jgi:autotransporter-associated beta strand protein
MRNFPILLLTLAPLALQAADITWDATTGTTGAQDGAGTWNTANTNWWTGAANASFVAGDNVTIGAASGAAGAITVDAGGVTAGTLTFNAPGSGSYTLSGGSITGGALTKNGANGLRLDNANTFTSILLNAGPNSASDGALRLGNAGAVGTAPITLANTATMTGLYFLTGFGTGTTLNNNITFASGAVQTNLLNTAGISQTVTLGGVLSGGNAAATLFLNNSATGGVAKFKLTNTGNTVLGNWRLNRGALEFTSDAALGDAANDLILDVTNTTAGTGLTFGANSISTGAGRSVSVLSQTVIDTGAFTGSTILGQITGAGNIARRGTTSLVPGNSTSTHSGGWTILTAPATGASQGSLHVTSASLSGGGVFSGLGTGAITATSAGTILSGGVTGNATNAIVLPNTATRHDFVAANATELTLSGVISGGGASNPTFYVNTDTAGGSTGVVKLTNANTFTGTVQVNRGGLALTQDATLGASTNPLVLDIGTATQVGLRFDAAFSLAHGVQLGSGKQVVNTNGNNATISGVISSFAAGGELFKTGIGILTLTNTETWAGNATVDAGTLLVNGSTTGTVVTTVNSGAVLGGTGSIVGSVTVAGSLSPGASIQSLSTGDVTMSPSSAFIYEAADNTAAGADLLTAGNLSLTTVTLDVSGANLSAGTWVPGDKLTLISYTGTPVTSGFTGYTDDTVYNFGPNNWLFDYNDTLKGNNFASEATGTSFITLTVVPEPGAVTTSALALAAIMLRRRRC